MNDFGIGVRSFRSWGGNDPNNPTRGPADASTNPLVSQGASFQGQKTGFGNKDNNTVPGGNKGSNKSAAATIAQGFSPFSSGILA